MTRPPPTSPLFPSPPLSRSPARVPLRGRKGRGASLDGNRQRRLQPPPPPLPPLPIIRVVQAAHREQEFQRIELTALQHQPVHGRQASVASCAVHERERLFHARQAVSWLLDTDVSPAAKRKRPRRDANPPLHAGWRPGCDRRPPRSSPTMKR